VKAGNYCQALIGLNDEHQRVRKATEKGAADILIDDRKLAGIRTLTFNQSVNRCPEAPSESWRLVFVLILGIEQLRSR
jgi:hypothetical protein